MAKEGYTSSVGSHRKPARKPAEPKPEPKPELKPLPAGAKLRSVRVPSYAWLVCVSDDTEFVRWATEDEVLEHLLARKH